MRVGALFTDRRDAGRRLAHALLAFRRASPLVLGLPRGGVPVAFEVARALDAPLDVWVVRKIGAPVQPELAMGAVAEGGEPFLDPHIVELVGASGDEVDALIATKTAEVAERQRLFRRGRGAPDVAGRVVILVDDGVATGATARAALRAVRRLHPKRLIFAAPVGATATVEALRAEADEVVCLHPRRDLFAIGSWYDDFSPTSDDDVVALLDEASTRRAVAPAAAKPLAR